MSTFGNPESSPFKPVNRPDDDPPTPKPMKDLADYSNAQILAFEAASNSGTISTEAAINQPTPLTFHAINNSDIFTRFTNNLTKILTVETVESGSIAMPDLKMPAVSSPIAMFPKSNSTVPPTIGVPKPPMGPTKAAIPKAAIPSPANLQPIKPIPTKKAPTWNDIDESTKTDLLNLFLQQVVGKVDDVIAQQTKKPRQPDQSFKALALDALLSPSNTQKPNPTSIKVENEQKAELLRQLLGLEPRSTPALNESYESRASRASVNTVPAPIYGGYIIQNGYQVVYVGGKPNKENFGLESPPEAPLSGQIRSFGGHSIKEREARVKAADTISPKDNMREKMINFEKIMIQRGLDSTAYLEAPGSGELVPVVRFAHLFTQETVRTLCEKVMPLWDTYAHEADSDLKELFLNTLTKEFAKEIKMYVPDPDAPFLELFMMYVSMTQNQSFDRGQDLQAAFDKIEIDLYPGENVQAMARDLKKILEELEDHTFNHLNYHKLFKKFLVAGGGGSNGESYRLPIRLRHIKLTELRHELLAIRNVDEKRNFLALRGFTATKICNLATTGYNNAITTKTWDPARDDKSGMKFPVANFSGGTSGGGNFERRTRNHGGPGRGRGGGWSPGGAGRGRGGLSFGRRSQPRDKSKMACRKCGELGHFGYECPKGTAQPSNNPKFTAPKSGETVRVVHGVERQWCAKCNKGRGMWVMNHNTASHGQRQSNAMANMSVIRGPEEESTDPSAWAAMHPVEQFCLPVIHPAPPTVPPTLPVAWTTVRASDKRSVPRDLDQDTLPPFEDPSEQNAFGPLRDVEEDELDDWTTELPLNEQTVEDALEDERTFVEQHF